MYICDFEIDLAITHVCILPSSQKMTKSPQITVLHTKFLPPS